MHDNFFRNPGLGQHSDARLAPEDSEAATGRESDAGIIPAVVAWTGVFGNIWLNGLITPWVLGFILLKVLYPYVKRWNMYWAASSTSLRQTQHGLSSCWMIIMSSRNAPFTMR